MQWSSITSGIEVILTNGNEEVEITSNGNIIVAEKKMASGRTKPTEFVNKTLEDVADYYYQQGFINIDNIQLKVDMNEPFVWF